MKLHWNLYSFDNHFLNCLCKCRHYTILAPSAFRVSTVYNVTATFYNVEAAVQLSLRLESENGLLVESEATLEKGTCTIILYMYNDVIILVEVFCKAFLRKKYTYIAYLYTLSQGFSNFLKWGPT